MGIEKEILNIPQKITVTPDILAKLEDILKILSDDTHGITGAVKHNTDTVKYLIANVIKADKAYAEGYRIGYIDGIRHLAELAEEFMARENKMTVKEFREKGKSKIPTFWTSTLVENYFQSVPPPPERKPVNTEAPDVSDIDAQIFKARLERGKK
jgi:hypothetical protein